MAANGLMLWRVLKLRGVRSGKIGLRTASGTSLSFLLKYLKRVNETLRVRIPWSEGELDLRLGVPGVVETRGYYMKFNVDSFGANFKPNSTLLAKLTSSLGVDTADIKLKPEVGSLVEAISNRGTVFGAVADVAEFIEIFTLDGHLVTVPHSDISLTIPYFFNKPTLIKTLDEGKDLDQLQYALVAFIQYCMKLDSELTLINWYDHIYLSHSANSTIRYIPIEDFLTSMLAYTSNKPRRTQIKSVLLFLSHFHITNSPHRYVINRHNTSLEHNQNITQYFAIPRFTSEIVELVSNFPARTVQEFRDFVNYMYNDSDVDGRMSANISRTLFHQKSNYSMIFKFLLYYISYPHPILKELALKLLGPSIDLGKVLAFLQGLGLVDSRRTDLTLSSQLVGTNWSLISVESVSAILPSDNYPLDLTAVSDHFSHLRRNVTLDMEDIKIVGIPLENSQICELAISILKKNSRDWIINFHLPDLGSFIAPKSGDMIFSQLIKRRFCQDLKLTTECVEFLPQRIKEKFQFKEGVERQPCLTYSFIFKKGSPFEIYEPQVRLDLISNIEIATAEEMSYAISQNYPLTTGVRYDQYQILSELAIVLKQRRQVRLQTAIETELPPCDLSLHDDQIVWKEDANPQFQKFRKELNLTIDSIMGKFCQNNKIPLYYHTQGTVSDTEILRTNDELSQLEFFYHLNSLDVEKVVTEPPILGEHKRYGFEHPIVYGSLPLHQLELLINQWQVLKFWYHENGPTFADDSQLILDGYRPDDMNSVIQTSSIRDDVDLISFYKKYIEAKLMVENYLKTRSQMQWIIKLLRQSYQLQPRRYEESIKEVTTTFESSYFLETANDELIWLRSIVTRQATFPNLARLYFVDLGVELEVLLVPDSSVNVGDKLNCSTIVYCNETEGRLIFMN